MSHESEPKRTLIQAIFKKGFRLYMKFPGVPYAYCELECRLNKARDAAKILIESIASGRLAYKIGLRNGDILKSINMTDVDEVSVESVADNLLWLDSTRPMVFGIKRHDPEQDVFLWIVFKLSINNGKPDADVIFKISNSTGVVPEFYKDFQQVNRFTYLSTDKANISQNDKYLTLSNNKLEFTTFNPQASLFHVNKYTSSFPSDGVPVSLVQIPPSQTPESENCIETVKPNDVVQLSLTSFPDYMTDDSPILSNGMFFFRTISTNTALHLFESAKHSGYCIARNAVNQEAHIVKPSDEHSEMTLEISGATDYASIKM